MPSIVVAARNEAVIVGPCLGALVSTTIPGEFDVTVAANGCTDDTAKIAASRAGVRVINLPESGKVGVLNAGENAAVGYPQVYLDTDIAIYSAGNSALYDALASSDTRPGGLLAATAQREMDVRRSPLLARAYYAINSQLQVYRNALFGRSVIVLSGEGRNRFDRFSGVVADDLFLESLFDASEKREVDSVSAQVAAPRRTRELVRRRARMRRGNIRMRASLPARSEFRSVGRRRARMSWLSDVALRKPSLIPGAICYLSITNPRCPLHSASTREGDGMGT